MTAQPESLGTLSTIVKRKTLTLKWSKFPNGKIYEVASAADFGPLELAALTEKQRLSAELQQRMKGTKRGLTTAQKRRLDEALDDVVKLLVLKIEPAAIAEMTEQQKVTITLMWMAAMQEEQPGNREARRRAARTPSRRPTGSR